MRLTEKENIEMEENGREEREWVRACVDTVRGKTQHLQGGGDAVTQRDERLQRRGRQRTRHAANRGPVIIR